MHPIVRITGIVAVFMLTAIAWIALGAVMEYRTSDQQNKMRGEVVDLWGSPQSQQAPTFQIARKTQVQRSRTETVNGEQKHLTEWVAETVREPRSPSSTDIAVDIGLDQRLKGLMWHSLYDLGFDGRWTYLHDQQEEPGLLEIEFIFPDTQSLYDDFRFVVDGEDLAERLKPESGRVKARIPVQPGQRVDVLIGYKSRGSTSWRYVPGQGVASLENFSLQMTTDFDEIDFPAYTMSPSSKQTTDKGWALDWSFSRVVTGHSIGMDMPERIQPGQLASSMSYSAPISLLFFFLVVFVISTLRGIDIHPINYLMIAAGFFAFHLLFGYTVDRMHIVPAFVLSSLVSVVLVISYLRLVVGTRFAFVEAAAAQLIYLVGFSMAHFFDGYTGLTVTVLSIITLFVLMQLTGRIKWSERLGRKPLSRPHPPVAVADAVPEPTGG